MNSNPPSVTPEILGRGTGVAITVLPDAAALTRALTDMLLDEYRAARAAGRRQVLFIVPVGPVGNTTCWRRAASRNASR